MSPPFSTSLYPSPYPDVQIHRREIHVGVRTLFLVKLTMSAIDFFYLSKKVFILSSTSKKTVITVAQSSKFTNFLGHRHPGGGILSGENTGRGFEYFDDNLVIMFEALVVSVELEL